MWHPKISSNAYQRSLDVQKCTSSTLGGWKLQSSWIVTYLVTRLLASWCVCVSFNFFSYFKNVKFFHQVGKGITFVTLHNMLASGLSPHIMLKHLTSVFHRLLPMLQGCFLSERLSWKKYQNFQEKIGTIQSKDAKHFQNQSPIMM
jgi:hypothetical protein